MRGRRVDWLGAGIIQTILCYLDAVLTTLEWFGNLLHGLGFSF